MILIPTLWSLFHEVCFPADGFEHSHYFLFYKIQGTENSNSLWGYSDPERKYYILLSVFDVSFEFSDVCVSFVILTEVVWMEMAPIGSNIWMLGSQLVEGLGKIRRNGFAGRIVLLSIDFDVSKAKIRRNLSAFDLWIRYEFSATAPIHASCLSNCCYASGIKRLCTQLHEF